MPEPWKIQLHDVSHRYHRRAGLSLQQVTLRIAAGEIVAIVGRSGSGKSSLLQLLAGLLRPTAGEVRIDGAPVQGPSPRWNLMFQNPSLYPWTTAAGNAAVGLRFAGLPRREAAARVREVLRQVHLEAQADTNVQQLSGGQQQRVALARSLAVQPDVLLLDEPFSALDATTRADLQAEVRRITRARDITTVLVTHDIDEALQMADRVFVLTGQPGRLARTVDVPVPHPRSAADKTLRNLRAELLAALQDGPGDRTAPAYDSPSNLNLRQQA